MRGLGCAAVIALVVVGAACGGDSFQAVPPSTGDAGGGSGTSGSAGSTAAGAGGSASGGGVAGTAGASSTGGSGGAEVAAGAGGGAGAAGQPPTAGAGGDTGLAGAGDAGAAGAGGDPGTAGTAGAAGTSGAAGSAGDAAGQGGGGSPPVPFHDYEVANANDVGAFPALKEGSTSTLSGSFDTDADCSAASALGACLTFDPPAPLGGGTDGSDDPDMPKNPPLCVCRSSFETLNLGKLALTGSRGLVVLAAGHVTITGMVRVSSGTPAIAPGSTPTGGYTLGGTFGSVAGGGAGLPVRGTDGLQPLLAGQDGQDACQVPGGHGGGILQLSTRGTLTITKDGGIDAGGFPASAPTKEDCGGPAGGSGGAILLEAFAMKLDGVVVANGASGSGGGCPAQVGDPGSPGSTNATPAPGGAGAKQTRNCYTSSQSTKAGDGGVGASLGGEASTGKNPGEKMSCLPQSDISCQAGGGGGGYGRIVLRYGTSFGDGDRSPKPVTIPLTPTN